MPPVVVKPVTLSQYAAGVCDEHECTVEQDGKITRAKNACAVSLIKFLKYNRRTPRQGSNDA
jgi:formylmethanofuran dehydrogenase subunit B